MPIFNLVFTILWVILFVWALFDIINAHKDTGWKLIWIIICLAFPIAGSIVYYIFARQKDMKLPEDLKK